MGRGSSEDVLVHGIAAMGLPVSGAAICRLNRYFLELLKWNRKMNLVAKAPPAELLEKHLLDSLTLLPSLPRTSGSQSLMDVGSGAGFPGLAIKIACPKLNVTLVEPRQKRASFLRHVIRTLELDGIRVSEARIQPADNRQSGPSGHYDIITSRALTGISDFLSMVSRFSPTDGMVICMKGPKGKEEMAAWQEGEESGCFRLHEVREWILPFSEAVRSLVIFTKSKNTVI